VSLSQEAGSEEKLLKLEAKKECIEVMETPSGAHHSSTMAGRQ
jgi:hypothetical protein